MLNVIFKLVLLCKIPTVNWLAWKELTYSPSVDETRYSVDNLWVGITKVPSFVSVSFESNNVTPVTSVVLIMTALYSVTNSWQAKSKGKGMLAYELKFKVKVFLSIFNFIVWFNFRELVIFRDDLLVVVIFTTKGPFALGWFCINKTRNSFPRLPRKI